MSDSAHILVFDSGVGALSIIEELRRHLPGASITYASDNAFFPYGTKPDEALVERVDNVLAALLAHCAPDLAVIACNTASTVALPIIREHFSLPIVGVVPAIKPAGELTRSNVIGLLATPATIKRPYTQELIENFAADSEVIAVGSSELVDLAEAKLRGTTVSSDSLQKVLHPFFEHPDFSRMDTLVLACTHFPLLKEEISQQLPHTIRLIDSGFAIARRVKYLIDELKSSQSESTSSTIKHKKQFTTVFTAPSASIELLKPAIKSRLPGPIEILQVPFSGASEQ